MPLKGPQHLFLDQARSDYATFRRLGRADACQRLHYLQMCTEKLSKAYLWRNGYFPGFGHDKFEPFLTHLDATRADLHLLFGYQDVRYFHLQKTSIWDLARRIQKLAPAHGNDGPNPEYPWPPRMPTTGPLAHRFVEWRDWNGSIAGLRLRHFIENLLENYAAIFP